MVHYGFKYRENFNDYQYWFESKAMPRLSRQQREQLDDCMLGKLPEWLQMTSTAVLGQLNAYVNITMQPTAQMTVRVVVDHR